MDFIIVAISYISSITTFFDKISHNGFLRFLLAIVLSPIIFFLLFNLLEKFYISKKLKGIQIEKTEANGLRVYLMGYWLIFTFSYILYYPINRYHFLTSSILPLLWWIYLKHTKEI